MTPIAVQLSKFEQLEILRHEIEARGEELKQVEHEIRETLYEIERLRYLQTLHPLFQQVPLPEKSGQLPQLNSQREALGQAIQSMQAALGVLEAETAGQTAPPSRMAVPPGGFRSGQPAAAPAQQQGAGRRRFDF